MKMLMMLMMTVMMILIMLSANFKVFFLQKTAFSLVKSRLALDSPGWLLLFVTMPKVAKYTET